MFDLLLMFPAEEELPIELKNELIRSYKMWYDAGSGCYNFYHATKAIINYYHKRKLSYAWISYDVWCDYWYENFNTFYSPLTGSYYSYSAMHEGDVEVTINKLFTLIKKTYKN